MTATHWWLYAITVENEIRGARGHVEFRWYSPVVTRFEASWAMGRGTGRGVIRVLFNEQEFGAFPGKDAALEQVHKLLARCPPQCRAEFEQNAQVLMSAVTGTRP